MQGSLKSLSDVFWLTVERWGIIALRFWTRFRQRIETDASKAAYLNGESFALAPEKELDRLVRGAESTLSSKLGRASRLRDFPVVFVVGPHGSGKTSSLLESGLSAELLAGQVHDGSSICPTHTANLWFDSDSETILVELAGDLLTNWKVWDRLMRSLGYHRLFAGPVRPTQLPRSALLCFPCDKLTPRNHDEREATVNSIRGLRTALDRISATLGISLPVYVVWTKTDTIKHFDAFEHNLSPEEARQAIGMTLPMVPSVTRADNTVERSRFLGNAFNDFSLAFSESRTWLLSRCGFDTDQSPAKTAGIYEFPRELTKSGKAVVELLTELGELGPITLRKKYGNRGPVPPGPFLRGFYFCGRRSVPPPADEQAGPEADAATLSNSGITTDILSNDRERAEEARHCRESANQVNKPGVVFLYRLLKNVILADRPAQEASAWTHAYVIGRGPRLAFGVIASLICLGLIVSFVGNLRLRSTLSTIEAMLSQSDQNAAATLEHLELARQSLVRLEQYNRTGVPWHLDWGLYIGNTPYRELKTTYFKVFRPLFFDPAYYALRQSLTGLPHQPAPGATYAATYNTLKAYLVITSRHEKSDPSFLSPALVNQWESAPHDEDLNQRRIVAKQFDFYAENLKLSNPYSIETDGVAVNRAREYLGQFAGANEVYQALLDGANANGTLRPVKFRASFPNSAGIVRVGADVPAAFTKAAWSLIQHEISTESEQLQGEPWVLGGVSAPGGGLMAQNLRHRYEDDYIKAWQRFLDSTSIPHFTRQSADKTLRNLAGPQSPLLELFCTVAKNTDALTQKIGAAFQPIDAVVSPSDCSSHLLNDSNTKYMEALGDLGNSDPNSFEQRQEIVRQAAREIEQRFNLEARTFAVAQRLLEAPITSSPRPMNPQVMALNSAAGEFCSQFRPLQNRYPFDPDSSNDVAISELDGIFRPGQGALWILYQRANLSQILKVNVSGSEYRAQPGDVALLPHFVRFFNLAATLSRAMYPAGSQQAHLRYSIQAEHSKAIRGFDLEIDGQSLKYTGGPDYPRTEFTWPGNGQGVQLSVTLADGGNAKTVFGGSWGVSRFLAAAQRRDPEPSGYIFGWKVNESTSIGNGRTTGAEGQSHLLQLYFEPKEMPLLDPGRFFFSLHCVSQAARWQE